jgi:hypothetical protein
MPAPLRRTWTRCADCGASDLDVMLVWEGGEARKTDTGGC